MLVRLPRKSSDALSRSGISEKLKNKIYKTLGQREVFWDRVLQTNELIIDHKFPSSRWKEGDTENSSEMSEQEIRNKFQLLTNQSNLLKEKACKSCVRENKRGTFLGIEWYYEGNIQSDSIIKTRKYLDKFKKAQNKAKSNKRNLWSNT